MLPRREKVKWEFGFWAENREEWARSSRNLSKTSRRPVSKDLKTLYTYAIRDMFLKVDLETESRASFEMGHIEEKVISKVRLAL